MDEEDKKKEAGNVGLKAKFQKVFSMKFFKPFSVIGILYVLVNLAGYNVLMAYMVEILEDSGSTVNAQIAPLIFGNIALVIAGKSNDLPCSLENSVKYITYI